MAQTMDSKFGKHRKLIVDDFDYCLHGQSRDSLHWSCQKKSCPATAKTDLDMTNFRLLRCHDHLTRKFKIEAQKFRNEMKTLARTTNDPPALIYDTVMTRVPDAVKPLIESKATCLRDILRQRRQVLLIVDCISKF